MDAPHHDQASTAAMLPGADAGAPPQAPEAPSLYELPLEVLEAIAASGLELRDRVALASCCAALWARADVASSSALWGQLSFRDEHVDPRHRKAALAAWLRHHAAAVERLRLSFAALGGPASALASLEGGPLAELQVCLRGSRALRGSHACSCVCMWCRTWAACLIRPAPGWAPHPSYRLAGDSHLHSCHRRRV